MFKRKLIEILKQVINNLEDELKEENERNRIYQKDMIVLLETNAEQRAKITDLENNIEFLVNQLSNQKRELVRPLNQN